MKKNRLLSTAELEKIRDENPGIKLQEERLDVDDLKTLRTQIERVKENPENENTLMGLSI